MHRPVALFFLPEPPEETSPRTEFRTLSESETDGFDSDVRLAIREALAWRDSIQELWMLRAEVPRTRVAELRPRQSDTPSSLAARVRATLTVDESGWRTSRNAMAGWRGAIEGAGVYVFKRSFASDAIDGFALSHQEFPVIVVNNGRSFVRQIFTLVHELGHILYGVTSVTKDDPNFLDRLKADGRKLEVACNAFAAELLLPAASFPWHAFSERDVEAFVSEVAEHRFVSREVVLRRLLDYGRIDALEYRRWVTKWAAQKPESREGSGGNYYANQATYMGDAYLNLAFDLYHKGKISIEQLAEHLRLKARNIAKLEHFLESRKAYR